MRLQRRTGIVLLLLLGVVGAKVGEQLYRWVAYADERALLAGLRERALDAGVEVVRSRARADTLRQGIEAADRELDARRRVVERYGRFARGGGIPAHLYDAYRSDLEEYNGRLQQRNARVRELRRVAAVGGRAVDRYNAIADSLRAVAHRLGDPYFSVPLPAEAAVERGLVRPDEVLVPLSGR